MLKDRVFGVNLLSEYVSKFSKFICGTEFLTTFNSARTIIYTLFEKWVLGSLVKGCFRFKQFRPALFMNLRWNEEKLKCRV